MLILSTIVLKAQQPTDTVEYKQIQISYKTSLKITKEYTITEDNTDGTVITNDNKYTSKMQALNIYLSKGWNIIEFNVIQINGVSTLTYEYIIKRARDMGSTK